MYKNVFELIVWLIQLACARVIYNMGCILIVFFYIYQNNNINEKLCERGPVHGNCRNAHSDTYTI